MVCPDRSDQVYVFRAGHAGYIRAERPRNLHGEGADASRGTVDQDFLPGLDLSVANCQKGDGPSHRNGRSLLERELGRLGHQPVFGDRRHRSKGGVSFTLQTLPGMLSVIVASVVGAIGALAALAIGVPPLGVVLATATAFVIAMVWLTFWGRRGLRRPDPSLEARFPSPYS